LRSEGHQVGAVRTHGDFHLGRLTRTDHGWVVSDFSSATRPRGVASASPGLPLGDVAQLMWSLSVVAKSAAAERDHTLGADLGELAATWEARNRRAVLAGYLDTPGIGELVGLERARISDVLSLLEFELSRRPLPSVRP